MGVLPAEVPKHNSKHRTSQLTREGESGGDWDGVPRTSSLRASLLKKNLKGADDSLAIKILQDGSMLESDDNNLSCMSLTNAKFSRINFAGRAVKS